MVLTDRYKQFFLSRNPTRKKVLFYTRLMAFVEVLFFVLIITFILINYAFGKSSVPIRLLQTPADSTDYFSANFIRYENFVYVPNIRTVLFHPNDSPLLQPVIRLNHGSDILEFSFDDLEGGEKSFRYKIIHCSFDWKPSDLLESQYQAGYPDDKINHSGFSFHTRQQYTHYQLQFPNENIRPVISGNFLLIVFSADDPDRILITRRFMVVDEKVTVSVDVHRATVIKDKNSKQEVDFSIFHPGYTIDNPFSDLKVALYQNDRSDNVITNLAPLFLKNDELQYDYEEGNVFNGGSEFRSFDTRSLVTRAAGIRSIRKDSTLFHVYLEEDLKRSFNRYTSEQDMNGRYIIRTNDGKSDDLEADYCWVHFRLPMETPFTGGNLYLFGSFTDWGFSNTVKLIYNEEEKRYEVSVFLKQGYYNYEYVFVEDGFSSANETEIEGNHFETENSYTVCVYNKPVGGRYDELIGIRRVNSRFN